MSVPQSMMNISRGRRVRSRPLTHGTITSAFGRPFTFVGCLSIARASSPAMSNAPPFVSPMKDTPRFSDRTRACVTSTPVVKLLLITSTGCPSSVRCSSDPSSCATIETRTAAPSTTHGSSDHAMKMSPPSLTRSSVVRFAPPRMEIVARRLARLASPPTIWRRASSCQ